jgi:hypothetical protein
MGLLFENVRCSRCGGSGRMPYAVYNGVCFKCEGKGAVLTKRGRAAQTYLDSLRKRRYADFKVGDLILSEGFTAGSFSMPTFFCTITEIKVRDTGEIELVGVAGKGVKSHNEHDPDGVNSTINGQSFVGGPDTLARAGFSKEVKNAQRAEALAYQETLTKLGTVRK